jgi:hypothetical protein
LCVLLAFVFALGSVSEESPARLFTL